jgi:hypothetical protein
MKLDFEMMLSAISAKCTPALKKKVEIGFKKTNMALLGLKFKDKTNSECLLPHSSEFFVFPSI